MKILILILLMICSNIIIFSQPDDDIDIISEKLGSEIHYSAKFKGNKYPIYIGYEQKYNSNIGIANNTYKTKKNKCRIISLKMIDSIYINNLELSYIERPWLYIMYIVSKGEGEYFNTINSYDRVNFTFGPFQFAAHVPDNEPNDFGYFLEYLKYVINKNKNVFPDLIIKKDKLYDKNSNLLEDKKENIELRKYLNHNFKSVDSFELRNIARLVNFINSDSEQSNIVKFTYEKLIDRFKEIDRKLSKEYKYEKGLGNLPATHCAVIFDILHNGRSDYKSIANILKTTISRGRYDEALAKLININMGENFFKRREHLLSAINDFMLRQDKISNYKYNIATYSFIKLP